MAVARPLTEKQREKFAEKIMEWGNLVFIGLVIAQLVPGTMGVRPRLAIAGLANFLGAYLVAYLIMKGGAKE